MEVDQPQSKLQLARQKKNEGDYSEALKLLDEYFIEINSTNPIQETILLDILQEQAIVNEKVGKFSEAILKIEQCRHLFLQSNKQLTDSKRYVSILLEYSSILVKQGKHNDAMDCVCRALEILQENNKTETIQSAQAHRMLGIIHHAKGKSTDALGEFQVCKTMQEQLGEKETFDYSLTLRHMTLDYLLQRKFKVAQDTLNDCLELQAKTIGTDHIEYAVTLRYLGSSFNDQNRQDEALRVYDKCLSILQTKPKSVVLSRTWNNIAVVLNNLRKYDEALLYYEKCRELEAEISGKSHADYATILYNIALVLDSLQRFDQALEKYKECREIQERTIGRSHPHYMITITEMRNCMQSLSHRIPQIDKQRDLLISGFVEPLDTYPSPPSLKFSSCLLALAERHRKSKTSLPTNQKYSYAFVDAIHQVSKTTFDRHQPFCLLYLSACIQHRLISKDVPNPLFVAGSIPNWTQLCPVLWNCAINVIRFSRLLLCSISNKGMSDVKARSVLMCILRTIANDSTNNQRYFNSILNFGSNRNTIGVSLQTFLTSNLLTSSSPSDLTKFRTTLWEMMPVSEDIEVKASIAKQLAFFSKLSLTLQPKPTSVVVQFSIP